MIHDTPRRRQGRCLVYGRCSKSTQDASLGDQYEGIDAFRREASLAPILEPFEDDGRRGHDETRPGLLSVLEYVRTHPNPVRSNSDFIPILVYDLARFGRFDDPKKVFSYFVEVERYGYEFYSVTEKIRSRGNISDFVQAIIKAEQAYDYSVTLSKYGLRTGCSLAEKGWWPGGTAPYAYDRMTHGPDGKPKYRYSTRPDKSVEKRSIDGKLVETLPPIEDKAVWTSAQDKLDEKKHGSCKVEGAGTRSAYLLTGDGLMKCAHCGYRFQGDTDRRNKIRRYLDGGYHMGGKSVGKCYLVPADPLETWMIGEIRKRIFGKSGLFAGRDELERAIEQSLVAGRQATASNDNEIKDLERRIAEKKEKVKSLVVNVSTEYLPMINDALGQLKKETEALEEELRALRVAARAEGIVARDFKAIARQAVDYLVHLKETLETGSADERKRFMRAFVHEIVVDGEKRRVKVVFYSDEESPLATAEALAGRLGDVSLQVMPPRGNSPDSNNRRERRPLPDLRFGSTGFHRTRALSVSEPTEATVRTKGALNRLLSYQDGRRATSASKLSCSGKGLRTNHHANRMVAGSALTRSLASYKSTACWAFSQNWGVILKVAARRTAISAVTAQRPLTMRLMTLTSQPIWSASFFWVNPIGLRNSS